MDAISEKLLNAIEDLRGEVAALAARVARLEMPAPGFSAPEPIAAPPLAEEPQGISEEELLAISAAIAAFLGVRVHIRQIRLVSSRAWAQEGRVSVQASHRLHS